MFARIVAVLLGIVFIGFLGYVFASGPLAPRPGSDKEITVVTSFYPLAEFSRQAGRDLITVTNITPPGIEPHDFEPTPRQLIQVETAQLFILNGSGLDPWAERAAVDLRSQGVTVLDMSKVVRPIKSDGRQDPHYWLDPVLAERQVKVIAGALARIDSAHKSRYQANARAFVARLQDMDRKYAAGLSDCRTSTVVATHEAFTYVARRYDLKMISIAGISPEQEPSPAKLTEISQIVKEQRIKYIFTETLASSRFADTIARETKARTLVLNPIEGLTPEDVQQRRNYLSIMQDNLDNLRRALQCR